ncbi:hypothetical protein GPECTOR_36g105 [Gonium pectorale]|uniref:Uncharacterized protein n=1 Tax=Gonium pectorale TaxID=33097 RepID=A0A150GBM6_GONPE|nr:hypothetical protein GPECTOR_36g105 [Gonium pectorale]|eukprot:KXZ47251.1 hypothetical protein GPECTOR_36g105 [Gonium pectorale]
MDKPNGFLQRHSEKAEHNQYWYSAHTIDKIVQRGSAIREAAWVFDFDDQWAKDPHFVRYDFNAPDAIPRELHGKFDCVVIDPPFITREVWDKYAQAARLLLEPAGKVVATTVAENAALLAELLPAGPGGEAVCAAPFRPSIPHLIYQYNLFTNFPPKVLCESNPEIPPDD